MKNTKQIKNKQYVATRNVEAEHKSDKCAQLVSKTFEIL